MNSVALKQSWCTTASKQAGQECCREKNKWQMKHHQRVPDNANLTGQVYMPLIGQCLDSGIGPIMDKNILL